MQFKDYYQILGVARDASDQDIKLAYRKLARKFHPDVSEESNAEARFKEVGEAYEVLKDPEKRAAYDRFGSDWKTGQEFHPPPDWNAGFEFHGTGGGHSRFSDFFENLFGQAGPFEGVDAARSHARGFRARGEDHHARIMISIEAAYHGGKRSVQLQMPELDTQGHMRLRRRKLSVNIPRGILAGQQIRLTGQGGPGVGGERNGDLYLEVEYEPHERFRVEARDIHSLVRVAPWEAALGARVPVETLGGKVELSVPAGAQSGQRLRLKERGMPGNPAGHHYVELRMVTPAVRDAADRHFYQQMAEHFSFDPRKAQPA